MFLDPDRPIATCGSDSCDGCACGRELHCHFGLKDWLHFFLISLPPFLLGGAGIYHVSGWLLVAWIVILAAFFGFVEIRVMCSHCPHYAEPEKSLKCWANYGSPKLWRYRPGPMTKMEKGVFFTGFAVVWGYPVPFLMVGGQWFLLLVYVMTTIGFFTTLKMFMRSQCFNFACPLNSVTEEARRRFFDRNPSVAKAWSDSYPG